MGSVPYLWRVQYLGNLYGIVTRFNFYKYIYCFPALYKGIHFLKKYKHMKLPQQVPPLHAQFLSKPYMTIRWMDC